MRGPRPPCLPIILNMGSRTRVILDTCVLRNTVHNYEPQLDFEAIRCHASTLAISIADSVVVELTNQLLETRVKAEEWGAAAPRFESILDPDWPIIPTGIHRAMFFGLHPRNEEELLKEQEHCKGKWQVLKALNGDPSCGFGGVYESTGSAEAVMTNHKITSAVIDDALRPWIEFIEEQGDHYRKHPATLDEITRTVREYGSKASSEIVDFADRLDFFFKAIAVMIQLASKGKTLYLPSSANRKGDIFDIMLLMALGLPAIVVTADKKFINRFTGIESPQKKRLISVEDFNDHLKANTIDAIVQ